VAIGVGEAVTAMETVVLEALAADVPAAEVPVEIFKFTAAD